jgi:dihydroxyacetone kinase-like protein
MFALKIAGAASSVMRSLDEIARVTTKARDNVRSIGVALAAGSIPETGARTFEIGDDEIEIGMGLHGEPGVKRQKLAPADEVVAQMLDRLLPDLPFSAGDSVCLLINNLGSTTYMEQLIVNRAVRKILDERRIRVHDTLIESYCTCQEMAGLSVSLIKLDDELRKYYDMPAKSLSYNKV